MVIFLNKRISLTGKDWMASPEEIEITVKELLKVLTELHFYPDFRILYHKSDLLNLLEDLKIMAELNQYPLTDPLVQIASLLNTLDAEDIYHAQSNSPKRFFNWCLNTMGVTEISASTLAYAAEYVSEEQGKFIIINLSKSEYNHRKIIPVLIDDHLTNTPKLVNLNWVIDADGIKEKIEAVRSKRIYHWSNKHGENGKGEWPGEAKLYCSREQAETYLQQAIGIKDDTDLYYYDNGRFLVFKDENANGQFHSYHVEERDLTVQVPNEIQKRLRPKK